MCFFTNQTDCTELRKSSLVQCGFVPPLVWCGGRILENWPGWCGGKQPLKLDQTGQ
jgi:hypothetical protein